MPKTKDVKQGTPGVNDPNEKTYRAILKIENTEVARITMRAKDDEDAKKQLAAARPSYFEGIGEWVLTKQETKTIEV